MDRKFPLQRRWHTRHDFSHRRTLGASAAPLPQTLLFISTIMDQGQSEECTAYSACAIRESMKRRQYDPSAFWNGELAILGVQNANGADLDTQGATARKIGFIPQGYSNPTDQIAAYVYVSKLPGMDWFDTLRNTLNRMQTPLSAGLDWYQSYNQAGGIIPHVQQGLLGGHDIKIAGFETRNGIDYLTLQNSWGTAEGMNGCFYMDRYMANQVFTYGITYFSDDPDLQFQRMGLLEALLVNVRNLYRVLVGKLGHMLQ